MGTKVDAALARLYTLLWDALERSDAAAVTQVLLSAEELQAKNPRTLRWSEERYELDVLGALAKGDDESVVARTAHLASARSDDPVGFARAIALVNLGRIAEAMEYARASSATWAQWLVRELRGESGGGTRLSAEGEILRRFLR